jgi:hypothetical protein
MPTLGLALQITKVDPSGVETVHLATTQRYIQGDTEAKRKVVALI